MFVGMTSTSALETSSVACMFYLSGASFSSLEMNSFLTNKLLVSCKIVTFAGVRDDSIPSWLMQLQLVAIQTWQRTAVRHTVQFKVQKRQE